ncbi:uncharacterized protein [Maniola hyperantus]|uniref:uncharacterized protein n=1 Tax=Aphantopus hyperantus TaxID=2795564 RepID=UPI0037478A97
MKHFGCEESNKLSFGSWPMPSSYLAVFAPTSKQITIIWLEEPCALQGGMCMRSEDCDPGNWVRIQADLCPTQKHLGIGCCYVSTIIWPEEPCALQGGMCMRSEDCDPGNWVRIQADLCPTQKHLGIGCCYN